MTPRRVLCLFYYFPPSGGAGALRCAAAARELPAFGWHPAVIAPRSGIYHVPGEDLAAGLPEGLETIRTATLDLRRPFGLMRRLGAGVPALARLERALLFPDPQWGWAPFARRAAARVMASGAVDALLSYGAPWTAHLTAMALARRYRKPWVAAFADEWSTATWLRPATPFHRRLARHLEGRVLARASAVAIATEGMARRLAAAHPGFRGTVEVVDNGYDEADFAGRSARAGDAFTLVYSGTMYGPTSPEAVLQALALLLARRPQWRPRIRLRVLGYRHPPFEALAARLGLRGVVAMEGPRPHAESVQAMLDAHALVLALADQPNAAAMRPVKLFEYLRAGRPILAFLPDGDAASLLGRFPSGERVPPGDSGAAARILERWMDRWASGAWPADPPPPPGVEILLRTRQVQRLAALLDRVAR